MRDLSSIFVHFIFFSFSSVCVCVCACVYMFRTQKNNQVKTGAMI